jgi:hypothetical protein
MTDTHFVPGHGDVADAKDVADFRAYLSDLRQLATAGRKAKLRDDKLVGSVAQKLRVLHPDWTISDRAIAAEVKYMDQELAGTKKRPVPVRD